MERKKKKDKTNLTWLKRSKKKENSKTKPWKFRTQAIKAQKRKDNSKRNAKERKIGRYKNYKIFVSNVVKEKNWISINQYNCEKKREVLKSNNRHTLEERDTKFWLQIFLKKFTLGSSDFLIFSFFTPKYFGFSTLALVFFPLITKTFYIYTNAPMLSNRFFLDQTQNFSNSAMNLLKNTKNPNSDYDQINSKSLKGQGNRRHVQDKLKNTQETHN